MFKEVAFLAVLVAFPLITNANVPSDIQERFLATIRGKDYISSFPTLYYWPPVLIENNTSLTQLCSNNKPGNYQNPFACDQFIMCADGPAWLAECQLGSGSYSPVADLCGYSHPDPEEACPWKSIWSYPDGVSCKTLGQRSFWGDLTLPLHPEEQCCEDIVYCQDYKEVGKGKCPPGFGYSKAYLGCLERKICFLFDNYFDL